MGDDEKTDLNHCNILPVESFHGHKFRIGMVNDGSMGLLHKIEETRN